jgi:hypothetical protein
MQVHDRGFHDPRLCTHPARDMKEALERASDLRFLWWAILGLNQ